MLTIAMAIMFSALIMTMTGTALGAAAKARTAREFVTSGQQSDNAIAAVSYQFNSQTTTFPTQSSPASSSGDTVFAGGWKWWATTSGTSAAGLAGQITAVGTTGKTSRTTTAQLYSMLLTSVKTSSGTVSYQLAPMGAFSHAILAGVLTMTPGSGVPAAQAITGAVGSTGTSVTLNGGILPTGGVMLYNDNGATTALSPTTIPVKFSPMALNFAAAATDRLYRADCTGTVGPWTASAHLTSGVAILAATASPQCYSSVTIDAPTRITGPGMANMLLPSGAAVSITAKITADPQAAMAIYGGNTTISGSSGVTQQLSGLYLFSPSGTCITQTAQVAITGSVACGTVQMTGQVTWAPLSNPSAGIDGQMSATNVWWTAGSVTAGAVHS